MSDSVDSSLSDGRLVQLNGLQDFAAYNGCIGRVFGRDNDGRYKVCVRVKGKLKKLLVQPGNIRVLSAQSLLHDASLAEEVRRHHYFAPGHLVKVLRGPHKGTNGRVARGSTSRLHDPHVLVHLDTKFRGPPVPCRQIDLRRIVRTEVLRCTDPTVQEIQRTWCRVLLQPAAGAASKPLHRVLKSLRLVDTLARERALMLLVSE